MTSSLASSSWQRTTDDNRLASVTTISLVYCTVSSMSILCNARNKLVQLVWYEKKSYRIIKLQQQCIGTTILYTIHDYFNTSVAREDGSELADTFYVTLQDRMVMFGIKWIIQKISIKLNFLELFSRIGCMANWFSIILILGFFFCQQCVTLRWISHTKFALDLL